MSTNLLIDLLEPSILQIQLNRPEVLNALSLELLEDLEAAFQSAKNNPAVRGVLITGSGKAFCAGADIKQLNPLNAETGRAHAEKGQAVLNSLEQLGKPSLAVINGFALGGGCELAMAASIRIASTTAIFGQPEVKLGLIPGFGGTQRLSRLVGKGRALDLCLSGRTIKADEAYTFGLVTALHAPEVLLSEGHALMKHLCQLAPIALQHILEVIHEGYHLPMKEALALEAKHFGICCGTQDKKEGTQAFLEKRPAVFEGK